ncbi:uncharacterized protein J3D65DRAFT_666821 [Phyllosticta citribraziliensis]|uniref:Uncharacterized protein n=1 Tax=Phyllosticta citribraziliensis TaxID=989973 RepID=A0ABR1LSG6_9PEZI
MAPALHPRSRQTVSLFTGTLLVSFFVVGLPHLLPCPVPTRAYADAPASADPNNPQRRRRRRRSAANADDETATAAGVMGAAMEDGRRARECPVPKPGGLVGKVLGFDTEGGARPRPTEVVVESIRARRERGKGGDQEGS